MTTTSEHSQLQQLSQELKLHQNKVRKLESTLRYQQAIHNGNNIPNRQSPRRLVTVSPANALHQEFEKSYKELYSSYLKKVISHNEVSLALEKGHVASILQQAEHYISNLNETPEKTTQLYETFLQDNNISNPDTSPMLKRKLLNNYDPEIPPPPSKQIKLTHEYTNDDTSKHFLVTGHELPRTWT